MSVVYRKIAFLFGLNIWGFGLLFAATALRNNNPVAWLFTSILLFAGSLLLSAALLPVSARKAGQ